MNRIKLIAFDLDGTLLTDDKRLTEYTRKMLRKATESGIEIVPATGRPLTAVPEMLLDFPGIRYIITSNGARIIGTKEKEILYEELLPREKAKEILDIFAKYDTMREVFFNGQGYVDKADLSIVERYIRTPVMAEYIRTTRKPVDDIDRLICQAEGDADKVQGIFVNPTEKAEALIKIKKIDGVEVSGTLAGNINNIEVNAAGVHKGAALLWLGKRLGIETEEIMAFGDGANDISMLEAAGIGVAMANGIQDAKDAADAVALSNEEDGVAAYVEKYVLV